MACTENLLLLTDSYKVSHHLQYPPGMTYLKAYFESRGGLHQEVVFFGLQYVLKRHLCNRVTMQMVDEAEKVIDAHFGRKGIFNREGWELIVKEHGGKIPIRVRAVPEGSVVPVKNVLFTVESTDERVPWVANYFEACLVQAWYPMTVCTNSFAQKLILREFAKKNSDVPEKVSFQLHDFGCRGSTTMEAAGIGGCAHLVNFVSTDTIEALTFARKYYGPDELLAAGFSIPASEHSTMTSWGKDHESDVARHMLDTFPEGPVAIVGDSYDLWNFVDNIVGKELKDVVTSRDGSLVVRPDSGDPVANVLKVLERLGKAFGVETNTKGYKVLHKSVSVCQGDGISYKTLRDILAAMDTAKWSSSNIVFGSGGALLQKLDRDTQKCAYKCCLAMANGRRYEVFKDPVTDPGKKSKAGDLTLVKENGNYSTVKKEDMTSSQTEELVTVFENGELVKEYTFVEVRNRTESYLQ